MTCPKRKPYLLLAFLVTMGLCTSLQAQSSKDSLLIAATRWKEKEVKKGLIWKQAHYTDLFGSAQEINLVEVDLDNKHIRLAFEGFSDSLALTSAMARETDAVAAINGAFFNTKEGGGVTLLKKEGKLINKTTMLSKDGKRTERSNGALLLNGRQTSIKGTTDLESAEWDLELKDENIMVCGPMLLDRGKTIDLEDNAFNKNRHPRSAVAVTKDRKLVLITVDGRNAQAQGMSLVELAYYLCAYGANEALNLDGGGSTTLYLLGEGVINYPSDNKLFDHADERKVANCLLVH